MHHATIIIHRSLPAADVIPARLFGNFMEQLGFSHTGGVVAQTLANATFERDSHLSPETVRHLLDTGRILTAFFNSGQDPDSLPERWSPGIGATGFGVSALDDETARGVPFPWAAAGGAISAAVGRIGGAVRLRAEGAGLTIRSGAPVPLDGPLSGVRQGVFLPFQRCLEYEGHLWVKVVDAAPGEPASGGGVVEVGLRRRLGAGPGECLAVAEAAVGVEWAKIPFQLSLAQGAVRPGEPVDFYIRWHPDAPGTDLLVDRAWLQAADAVDGLFDPDVLAAARDWRTPLLRWPGGNFVSGYHWRDGVGPMDRRPARPNRAWGGWDENFFGTLEFLQFCQRIEVEPHLTVNTATGTPEEAAAWVEFVNGAADTPMGKLRAAQGYPEPFGVRVWEAGNEVYGSWQEGYHGADENADRFMEFAVAMRAVDPSIELIATGNQFDIAQPAAALDHTASDRRWNEKLLAAGAAQMDYLGLHCLPANEQFLEKLSERDNFESLMAQPEAWERVFLPRVEGEIAAAQANLPESQRRPIHIAITEWAVLGSPRNRHAIAENYGEAVYAGAYLNMCIRMAHLVRLGNATGLLHGGCIRRAGGLVFVDAQYEVIRRYAALAGGRQLASETQSPAYTVRAAPDLGLPLEGVPYLDTVAVERADGVVVVCAVNRSYDQPVELRVAMYEEALESAVFDLFHHLEISHRARPKEPNRFQIRSGEMRRDGEDLIITMPPASVGWVTIP